MIIYVPRLIESAEQAEALPLGTVALQSWGHGTTARTLTNARWVTPSGSSLPHAETVGFTALVPIEAEEEWKTLHEGAWHLKADEHDARRDANALGARRRYTTDWEEA